VGTSRKNAATSAAMRAGDEVMHTPVRLTNLTLFI
jgi:hypothetical protein